MYKCELCQKDIKYEWNLNRHREYSCKKNPNRVIRSDYKKKLNEATLSDKAYENVTENEDIEENDDNEINDKNSNVLDRADVEADELNQKNHTIHDKLDLNDSILEQQMGMMDNFYKSLIMELKELKQEVKNQKEELKEERQEFKEFTDGIQKKLAAVTMDPDSKVINVDKIQLFITDQVDFVDVLTHRWNGDRKRAVDYVKSKIRQKVDGDIDLFCDIYLYGSPDTWSISCPDKKNHIYRIIQPNSEIINDPGGIQIHRNFKNNYSNTLLRLNNTAISETIAKANSKDFEASCDRLLDEFELGMIQDKAYALIKSIADHFIRKLSIRFKMIEKSYEIGGFTTQALSVNNNEFTQITRKKKK